MAVWNVKAHVTARDWQVKIARNFAVVHAAEGKHSSTLNQSEIKREHRRILATWESTFSNQMGLSQSIGEFDYELRTSDFDRRYNDWVQRTNPTAQWAETVHDANKPKPPTEDDHVHYDDVNEPFPPNWPDYPHWPTE